MQAWSKTNYLQFCDLFHATYLIWKTEEMTCVIRIDAKELFSDGVTNLGHIASLLAFGEVVHKHCGRYPHPRIGIHY